MSAKILIPDLGGMGSAEVIEILVKVGDTVQLDDPLIVMEGEKATVEVPSSNAGKIQNILCKVGDKLQSGAAIVELEEIAVEPALAAVDKTATLEILLPDVGVSGDVKIIEVLVQEGDTVNQDDSILTLESEKASMDVPSPYTGTITKMHVKKGDSIATAHLLASIEVTSAATKEKQPQQKSVVSKADNATTQKSSIESIMQPEDMVSAIQDGGIHAGPAVRRISREFGVDLTKVRGTGRKRRIIIEDVQDYVKSKLNTSSAGIPELPVIDHAKYGEIEYKELSNIKKATASHMHRVWANVPQVTHFDNVDITELEARRKSFNKEHAKDNLKLTPLVFIMQAMVKTLQEFPAFNSSISADGSQMVLKKYYNLGIAVDTEKGLVVPVIKDVDKKDIVSLSKELSVVSKKAREVGLQLSEMQGNTFTISSLGGIGGSAFTPIVNAPDVAILGVSKSSMQPVFIDNNFVPRLILPYAISYDHRIIDGAEAARFSNRFKELLGDISNTIDNNLAKE